MPSYPHTCVAPYPEESPCAACDIVKYQRIAAAVDRLGTADWSAWADKMIPVCPRWKLVRDTQDDGYSWDGYVKTWGSYASTFVKLLAAEAL